MEIGPFSQRQRRALDCQLVTLTTTVATDGASLHLLQLCLKRLDLSMGLLQILVETVALGNELLLPLPETLLLDLDLLGEPLSESLLLLLILGVVELSWAGFSKFAGLHLLCAVCLIVKLLGGVDEVEHVSANQDGSELLEVTVILVLNFGDTPRVLATLDNAAVAGLDVLLGSDDSERHGGHQTAGMLGGGLIVLLNWRLVDLDALGLDDSSDLTSVSSVDTTEYRG